MFSIQTASTGPGKREANLSLEVIELEDLTYHRICTIVYHHYLLLHQFALMLEEYHQS